MSRATSNILIFSVQRQYLDNCYVCAFNLNFHLKTRIILVINRQYVFENSIKSGKKVSGYSGSKKPLAENVWQDHYALLNQLSYSG